MALVIVSCVLEAKSGELPSVLRVANTLFNLARRHPSRIIGPTQPCRAAMDQGDKIVPKGNGKDTERTNGATVGEFYTPR